MWSDWSGLKKLIWLYMLRGTAEVIRTVTGHAPVTIEKAIEKTMKFLYQNGLTKQDGTPTKENPVALKCNNGNLTFSGNYADMTAGNIVVGKYISAQGVISDSAQNFYYSGWVPAASNTDYTLSFSKPVYFVSISEYDNAGFLKRTGGSNYGAAQSITITTTADTTYLRFGANMDGSSTVTVDMVLDIKWMLAKSSTPQTWKPYGAIAVGTPEVLRIRSGAVCDSADGQGTFVSPNPATTTRIYKALDIPDGAYSFVASSGWNIIVQYKNDSGTDSGNIGTWFTSNSVTLDKGDGYKYGVAIKKSDDSAITPSSFTGKITVVRTDGTSQTAPAVDLLSVGNYKDMQEFVGGHIYRNCQVRVFTGDERLVSSESNPHKIYWHWARGDRPALSDVAPWCTHFKPAATPTWSDLQDGECLFEGNDGGQYYSFDFYAGDMSAAELEALFRSEYIAGTPVMMVIPQGTVTEDIDGVALSTNNGMNVISVTSNVSYADLRVVYYSRG